MDDASFLLAGIKFDRKKFAKDFERFKKDNKDLGLEVSIVGNGKYEQEEGDRSSKKRKRKGVTGGSVEGFSVIKSSNPTSEIEQNDVAEDESSEKEEVFRQLEWNNILRKNYGIHVSGSNVPSPLQSFDELKTRYKCKSYLLRNFAELGYVEPTPIQRQAIPVLLSGREFFACASTGSGKTLAFVCPILMKLKVSWIERWYSAVILCPARKLAAQTTRECKKLTEGKKF
ncbi:hypothetical protein Cgig2_002682 [Carnegiea gigantea]|uniref:Helicase ATP-binding domain-containing protein n=1 Tax=Carnegiea gigantea TaxID=171969 RepID=A0A9Q1JLM8_9CARY|nr:hypothetical protein Cgig2_002682 [Carnegiea gigantea]